MENMLHVQTNVSPNHIGNVNAVMSVMSITVSDSLNFNKPLVFTSLCLNDGRQT